MKKTWRKAVSMGMALLLTLSVVAAGSGSSPVLRESVQAEVTVDAKAQQAATVEEAVEELAGVPQQTEAPAPEGKTVSTCQNGNDGPTNMDCHGDCPYCPTIILPGIGQSRAFLLDEEGNRAVDAQGNEITSWPLYFNVNELIKELAVPLVKMLITQKDDGFTDKASDVLAEMLSVNRTNPDGTLANKIETVRYYQSFADCDEEDREYFYRMVPVQPLTDVAGEDHVYFFTFNAFGEPYEAAEDLNDYIQMVKEQTGHEKVNLLPVSLGGTVATAYFSAYPETQDINKVVNAVAALDGSSIVSDLLGGSNIITDEYLYTDLFPDLIGEDEPLSYLVNVLVHIIPKQIIYDLLDKALSKVLDTLIVNCPSMWALVPSAEYPALRERYLSDEAHAALREKTDRYYQAQKSMETEVPRQVSRGIEIYNLCGYGMPFGAVNYPYFGLVGSAPYLSTDEIIEVYSTAMHAKSTQLGKTFPDGYQQDGAFCKEASHHHLSPDRTVDASAGVLPEQTWYYRNQDHEGIAGNDAALKLAATLLLRAEPMSVHSFPERFPQFNGTRNTKKLRRDVLPVLEQAEADGTVAALPQAQRDELYAAMEQVNTMLASTIADDAQAKAAEARLRTALADAGLMEGPSESAETWNKIAKTLCQFISDVLYKVLGPRGFSDVIRHIK